MYYRFSLKGIEDINPSSANVENKVSS